MLPKAELEGKGRQIAERISQTLDELNKATNRYRNTAMM